jgi:small subunit ribosomal protein S16
MPAKIRFKKFGKSKHPYFRLVVQDGTVHRDGKTLCELGQYQPRATDNKLKIDVETTKAWLAKGAEPTDSVSHILSAAGIMEEPARLTARKILIKKINDEKAAKAKEEPKAEAVKEAKKEEEKPAEK